MVGESTTANSAEEAFRFNLTNAATGAGTMTDLGNFGPNLQSDALAVSGDGTTTVGWAVSATTGLPSAVLLHNRNPGLELSYPETDPANAGNPARIGLPAGR